MLCSLDTQVTEEKIAAINALEKDLGKTLIAFQCHNLKPSELSEAELQRIQEVETKLGLSLVAVDA
ncbi:MAG: hypothetical protein QNJ04_05830 [Desulfobacterales bacterium]|nr:hypothetical protein [Desulfobacterales bacterium]